MSEKHKNCTRAFIRSSKAYYSRVLDGKISVSIGMYDLKDGGTTGEFEIEWVLLSGVLCAQLKSFEDSWSSLWMFKDLLEKMAEVDGREIQEPEFCKMLESLGIRDITQYRMLPSQKH